MISEFGIKKLYEWTVFTIITSVHTVLNPWG